MVVPSEKNAEILDLVMEKSDFKPSALEDSPTHEEENKTIDSATSAEDDVDSDELKIHTDNENITSVDIQITVPVIIEDLKVIDDEGAKTVAESQSFLSLSHSESSMDGVLDESVSVSGGLEDSKNISFDRHLSTNSIDFKDAFETKSVDTIDSSLFENTQEPLELGCDESHDVPYAVFETAYEGSIDVQEDESPTIPLLPLNQSPPRPQATLSPLLTSTPYSLPPMPRTRVSSTPCAPPSPLNSPYLSTPTPLNTTDGPMSLPTMSHSGSKSYDYLLKV